MGELNNHSPEMPGQQPPQGADFDTLLKEYLHVRSSEDTIKILSQMEGVATTREELEKLERMLTESPLKKRVQNRLSELQ